MKKKNNYLYYFQINKGDGAKYANRSGDKNKIHINERYGYNSIFGQNIIHGTFVIAKFLKKINFKIINKFFLNIEFKNPFFYKRKIYIKLQKKNSSLKYYLIQDNKINAIISISNKFNNDDLNTNFYPIKKNFYFKKNKVKYEINRILYCLSRYVGMIYPGKNSLLSNIKFYYKKNLNAQYSNKILIESKILKKGFPIIINNLRYKNYHIYFETLFRPEIKKKKSKFSIKLKKQILKIKENILIIGGSQGIGNSLFEVFKLNKKIKKIISYNKNKIKSNLKNIVVLKIDIRKDLKKILKIIDQNIPLRIYYLPSTKIYFDNKLSYNVIREYEDFFLKIPIEILKWCKGKNIIFFYPSTTNIGINRKSIYSKIKLKAENKIRIFCEKNKLNYNIHRFPAIYSRQSISILNTNPLSLTEYLRSNQKIINSIFPVKFDKYNRKNKYK